MKNLCVIPARSGSKRIPQKNTKEFLGKPILSYAIENALLSELFDEIMVSTDSEDIARIAKNCGARVPFLRSGENSGDNASTVDALLEVLNEYAKKNIHPQSICCLYPTSVFATPAKLRAGFELMVTEEHDSVISIASYGHPVQRAFSLRKNKVRMLWPENSTSRTQDLPPTYYDAAQFYWLNAGQLKKNKRLFTDNTGAIKFGAQESQDIDTVEDWAIAELKFGLQNKNNG